MFSHLEINEGLSCYSYNKVTDYWLVTPFLRPCKSEGVTAEGNANYLNELRNFPSCVGNCKELE